MSERKLKNPGAARGRSHTDSAPKTSADKRERSRARIKTAARKVFAKKGFDVANVSDIVKGARMSQGSFYYHFPDKKSILIEMVSEFFDELKRVTAEWMRTTDAGAETAGRFARRVATLLYENRELARIIMMETHNPDPEIRKIIKEFYQYIYQQTEMGLVLGMQLGLVRRLDPKIVAVALVGMIEQVIAEAIDAREQPDIEKIINEIIELQNKGIRPEK